MGPRVRVRPAQVGPGRHGDRRRKPPDLADSDVIDAILAEVEWEDSGDSGVVLDGWWSDSWSARPHDAMCDR